MELINKIEAILFISGKPVSIKEIASSFEISCEEVKNNIIEMEKIKRDSGLNIKIFDDETIQLVTNPNYGKSVSNFFTPEAKPKKLTKAALETLAITAYNQPVTKGEIESIRGVNVEKVLTTLEEKNLIEVCGKKNTIGTPNLYRVTEEFLSYFGIKKIEELPKYGEINDGKDKN
jgi:segregation and condensation protein B